MGECRFCGAPPWPHNEVDVCHLVAFTNERFTDAQSVHLCHHISSQRNELSPNAEAAGIRLNGYQLVSIRFARPEPLPPDRGGPKSASQVNHCYEPTARWSASDGQTKSQQ